jgi:hypothetical protein
MSEAIDQTEPRRLDLRCPRCGSTRIAQDVRGLLLFDEDEGRWTTDVEVYEPGLTVCRDCNHEDSYEAFGGR